MSRHPVHGRRLAWLLAPLLVILGTPLVGVRGGELTVATSPEICEADLRAHLEIIASEEFEGRETGQPGARRAGDYLAAAFERLGVAPAGDDGTYFQTYAIPRPTLGETNSLVVSAGDVIRTFAVEKDWNPFSAGASAAAEGPVVFAGYGITAPERSWDDYEGVDVTGKVVLIFRKDPGWNDTRHAAFVAKLTNAAAHGAAALLLCNDPATSKNGGDALGHWSANLGPPVGSGPIPYAFVTQDVARTLLEDSTPGADLDALEIALRKDGPQSAELPGVEARIETSILATTTLPARNVCGLVRGSDPEVADEVVVIGAHYDHIGRGRFGSAGGGAVGRVHPGADDNGSGTVAVLELAEWFAQPGHAPRRTLLFLAFSGEEMGLLGSRHWVEHPTHPLPSVVAMINMDMIGRSREGRLHVGGVGTAAGLQALVAAANEDIGLALSWNPQGGAPSDSGPFFRKKIPVLFLFTGVHEDYHRPSDTSDRIAYEGLVRVARLAQETARRIADAPKRLVYQDPPARKRPPYIGVQLETKPDARGVAIRDVSPGGPAETGGLQAGDVLVSVAGHVVRDRRDLLGVLGRLAPGRAVSITVLRGEERLVLELVPTARRRR